MSQRVGGIAAVLQPAACSGGWLLLAAQCSRALNATGLVLGSGPDAEAVLQAGASVHAQSALALGSLRLGMRAAVRQFAPSLQGKAAVAWSAAGAAVALHHAQRVLLVAGAAGSHADVEALRVVLRSANGAQARLEVLPFDVQTASCWKAEGLAHVHGPVTVRPEVAGAARAEGSAVADAALHKRWSVPAQAQVVGLVGGPSHLMDAQRAVDVVARATLVRAQPQRPPMAVVAHPQSANLEIATRWAADSPQLVQLVLDADVARVWKIAGGLDAALCVPTVGAESECSSVDAWIAAHLGLPVVAGAECPAAAVANQMPDRVFPAGRSTTGARAIAGALAGPAAEAEATPPLQQSPDHSALVSRIQELCRSAVVQPAQVVRV